jgi:glycosyltransferase involved in cell wall biosynthesis
MCNKIIYLYKTPREQTYNYWESGKGPDTILYGANRLRQLGYKVKFSDISFSNFNLIRWLFYPIQYLAARLTGIGFKLDQALLFLPIMDKDTVVVSTMDTAGLPLLFLKKLGLLRSRVIYISIQIAQLINSNPDKFPFNWYKSLFKYADAIVCYSAHEENILKNINSNTYFIPPGTDVSYYAGGKNAIKKKSRIPVILAFGWDTNRDYKTFAAAVKDKEVRGVIVSGKENVSEMKIPSNINIYYDLRPWELRKLIFESDIVVIPVKKIKWATGQLSTLDALACKKPVIISNLPSLIDTFNLKNGINCLTYTPENHADLSNKIDILISNRNLCTKIAEAGLKTAKNYSTEIFAIKLSDIIKKLTINE